MAEQLNNKKAKMGIAVPVKNTRNKRAEAASYFAVKIEDETGKIECWILLTEKELYGKATYTGGQWLQDFKRGRTYSIKPADKLVRDSYYLKLERPSKTLIGNNAYEEVVIRVSDSLLAKAVVRAARNPEDIPGQSWWDDLLD